MIWIYKKVIAINGVLDEKDLNEAGADGWEHYYVLNNTHYFKKQVPAPVPAAAPKNKQ